MLHHWHENDVDGLTLDDIRSYCAASPAYVAELDEFGYTPLIAACGKGKLEIARALLEAGADPNYVAPDGMTPIKAAIPGAGRPFNRALLDMLLDAGAKLNTGCEPPLHLAVAQGNADLVTYLIEHGADPNLDDVDGSPPLFWAGAYGDRPDVEMMRLLFRLGADPGRRDGVGRTLVDHVGVKVLNRISDGLA